MSLQLRIGYERDAAPFAMIWGDSLSPWLWVSYELDVLHAVASRIVYLSMACSRSARQPPRHVAALRIESGDFLADV